MTENQPKELSFQDRLKADRDGSFRREVIDQLGEVANQIKRRENEGLTEAEFKSLNGLKAALEESKEVVNTAWEIYSTSSKN